LPIFDFKIGQQNGNRQLKIGNDIDLKDEGSREFRIQELKIQN